MFKLEFSTDNAAFDGSDLYTECERILRTVAERVGRGGEQGTISDANGNTVGKWSLEVSDESEG